MTAGRMLGRYELLAPIATGGMGNVWAARLKGTRGFRKLVAIKTILNTVEDPRLEQMLFQEATLASQIQHPNVVETIELGEHEGTLYLVMDLVEGESLSFLLQKAQALGGIPLHVGVNLIAQVCRGVQAAHELTDKDGNRVGLVHRDISPPNVLVTYSGTVKIVDFGVATTSSSATSGSTEIKGKISYLAPEQLRAQPLDARVDVFAVGIMLYLLTANRHPFRSTVEADTIGRILSDAPVTPPSAFVEDYPDALEAVLLRALEKRRERRFSSAAAFLDALESAAPWAFGSAADRAVADFVQLLLKDRILERRHELRAAEENTESSPSASVLSLPAVAATRPPNARLPRSGVLPFAGLVLTLGGLVLAAQSLLPARHGLPTRAAPAALAMQERSWPAAELVRPLEATATVATPAVTPALAHVSPASTRSVEKRSATSRATRTESSEDRPPMQGEQPETATPDPILEPYERAALAVGSGLPSTIDEEPAAVASNSRGTLTPIPQTPKPVKRRQVASKLGHGKLASDPTAEAHRARLPQALQRSGHHFNATLNICVTANGNVSGVKFVKSAGPMIDHHLAIAVAGWRYRPLLESGQAVPFCYVLRYEFAGR